MAAKTKKHAETENERRHGHCADELMKDFGIPKSMRPQVCDEVAKVWKQVVMIHSSIIWSVRGYQPHQATRSLEHFLNQHATHEQKNRKPEPGMGRRSQGYFDSKGEYQQRERDDF